MVTGPYILQSAMGFGWSTHIEIGDPIGGGGIVVEEIWSRTILK